MSLYFASARRAQVPIDVIRDRMVMWTPRMELASVLVHFGKYLHERKYTAKGERRPRARVLELCASVC
jgi:hypothetical protein